MTKAELLALLSDESLNVTSKPKAYTSKSKVVVQAITASQVLATPVKSAPQVINAPADAEPVVYGDKNIAIHKVRKAGEDSKGDGWVSDYVQFTGVKGHRGDFTLTMNQARLLADPDVYAAFSAYMEKIPS